MLAKKTMIYLLIVFAIVVIAIVAGGWHFLFGKANPPLPQASVTIVSSSTPSTSVATTSVTSTTVVSSTTTTSSTSIDFPNPQLPTEALGIDNATFTVEIASTMIQQARGLSYRRSLGANNGMLFIFSFGSIQSFWMKDMNFPLDIIWISGNTVVGFAQNAPAEPNVIAPTSSIVISPANTDKVLEVNAGMVAKYNIKIGDTVTIGD